MSAVPANLRIEGPYTAVVIGARGGVGQAFVASLQASPEVAHIVATGRDLHWCRDRSEHPKVVRAQMDLSDEASVAKVAEQAAEHAVPLRLVVNASGLLHDGALQPERSLRDLDPAHFARVLDVHTVGVASLLKHFLPRFPRSGRSVFATLSARVGSIGDNRLGGWYSYRASKAAQNMLVKCAAIEAARRQPELVALALHPGTVHSALSQPFTGRLRPDHAVFTPEESCQYLCQVIRDRDAKDSGGFYAWDGQAIPW